MISSCENEDNSFTTLDNRSLSELYYSMKTMPTSSIISHTSKKEDSSRSYQTSIPGFTEQDLEYLSSLSRDEFESFHNYLLNSVDQKKMFL